MCSVRSKGSLFEQDFHEVTYVGGSDGDRPESFELFVAAIDGINLHRLRTIRSAFVSKDDGAA